MTFDNANHLKPRSSWAPPPCDLVKPPFTTTLQALEARREGVEEGEARLKARRVELDEREAAAAQTRARLEGLERELSRREREVEHAQRQVGRME